MQKQQLKDSIELLSMIRMELQSNVDEGIIQNLDEVIDNLKKMENDVLSKSITAMELIILIGKLIERIPTFALVIENIVNQLVK